MFKSSSCGTEVGMTYGPTTVWTLKLYSKGVNTMIKGNITIDRGFAKQVNEELTVVHFPPMKLEGSDIGYGERKSSGHRFKGLGIMIRHPGRSGQTPPQKDLQRAPQSVSKVPGEALVDEKENHTCWL